MKLCVGVSASLWSTWTCKNDIWFKRTTVIDPFVILHKTCPLIDSWSILQINQEDQKDMIWGVKLLE